MPYTLTKGLLWFLIALVLGVVVGWLLRSIRATRQVRLARHARHDSVELEHLRGRLANLEPLVTENARLRAELQAATGVPLAPGDVAALPEDATDTGTEAAIDARVPGDEPEAAAPAPDAAPHVPSGEPVEPAEAFAVPADDTVPEHILPDVAATAPDGAPELDDLTAIVGIDAATADLCRKIGIQTWADLAGTEVSLLRTMLADAGPRAATVAPDTWPEQAALLAAGRRDDFRALAARLEGGTTVE